jgi:hypothetical protein
VILLAGPADTPPAAVFDDRRQIWFDGPDGAYLAMAAMRRYLDADLVSDVVLVPSSHGPALELPSNAVSMRLVQALIWRFGGHIGRAGPDPVPPVSPIVAVEEAI